MEGEVFCGDVQMVTLPGGDGTMGILRDHQPVITQLIRGTVKILLPDDREVAYTVESGISSIGKDETGAFQVLVALVGDAVRLEGSSVSREVER
jgi:F-type H+-transporting ATPase subunit epsilon